MKATTTGGDLQAIPGCEIRVPNGGTVQMYILPEITDSKSASYQDEAVIGRSFPIKTYSHSDNRSVTMKVHFIILKDTDAQRIMQEMRWLQSATYPRSSTNAPFAPPPVCKLKCGKLLAGQGTEGYVCAVLRQYSVSFPTDVAWYKAENSGTAEYLPYKFSMDLTWDVVYESQNLPGQDQIIQDI